MSVQLEAIAFNHDPTSATRDALNIRRNARQFVAVPEWRRGARFHPEDSVAAYAISATAGQTITIHANFTRGDPGLTSVEVRAVRPPSQESPAWWQPAILPPLFLWPASAYYYLWNYYYHDYLLRAYLWQLSVATAGNVLGEVSARQVTFQPDGQTGFTAFALQNVRLGSGGAGRHTVTWRWQYRRGPGETWIDFATSHHQIYAVPEVPTTPWLQLPFDPANTQLPWTEVMDYACRWARGASTLDDVATRVTRAVYDLGPTVIQYDCLGPGLNQLGSPHYTFFAPTFDRYFNCTEFLERLAGGEGNGVWVNCSDCAAIVGTFANILGCDLWQSRMRPPAGSGAPAFAVNPILAIGSPSWQSACGALGFSMHEVAWKGDCTENDEVFDACLQVNGGADPTRPPQIPLLPTNMRFGNPGEGQYRDRLAAPDGPLPGRSVCVPQPGLRRRRLVI